MNEEKKSRLAKAAAIFGIVVLVSLGLCGVSFWIPGVTKKIPDGMLVNVGFFELLGTAGGAIGLLTVGIVAIVKGVVDQFSAKSSDSVSIIEKDEDK